MERRPDESPSWAERTRSAAALYWRATRIPVLALLGWFTASHLFFDGAWVFVDYANILFHEAGHVFFAWSGPTLHALGGTLLQVGFPVVFAVYFWRRRERFAAIACAWWVGENLVNVARYQRDAVPMNLPLIGGDVHDWNFLFRRWGALERSADIASTVRFIGLAAMIASLALLVWWTLRPSGDELSTGYAAPD